MKKTFSLSVPGKDNQRVIEGVKNEIRKYLKRERRKPLSTGVDFWDFDCKVGLDQATAKSHHVAEIIDAVGETATAGASHVFVEILSKPGRRTKKPVIVPPESVTGEPNSSIAKDHEDEEGTTGLSGK